MHCTTVGKHSVRYTKEMSQTYRRHIGVSPACSCKHRRCIFDVEGLSDLSPMLAEDPELLHEASAMLWRCLHLCFLFFYFHPVTKGIASLSMTSFGSNKVPRKISPPFICSPQGTIPSPWHRQHITTTLSKHHHYAPDASPIFVSRTPKDYRASSFLKIQN